MVTGPFKFSWPRRGLLYVRSHGPTSLLRLSGLLGLSWDWGRAVGVTRSVPLETVGLAAGLALLGRVHRDQ